MLSIFQRRRRPNTFKNPGSPPERRSTFSMMSTNSYQVTRTRNLSGGSNGSTASGSSTGSSTQLDNQFSSDLQLSFDDFQHNANSSVVPQLRASSSHRKLDRSLSDSDSERLSNSSSQRSVNSSRYKTELCRPFEESGSCKYGDKCQFAHGMHELRNLARHPKYKTELCRTFHTNGLCPYGPRCHFIHGDDSKPDSKNSTNSKDNSPSLSPSGSDSMGHYPSTDIENRPVNSSLSVNTDDLKPLRQQFSALSILKYNSNISNTFELSSPTFNSNSSGQSSSQDDIFSGVTLFNPDEILDNAPKQSPSPLYYQKMSKVDNISSHLTNGWQNIKHDYFTHIASVDPFHYSPTGSTGSDSGNISDCSGSMESLASSDQLVNNQHFDPQLAVLRSVTGWS